MERVAATHLEGKFEPLFAPSEAALAALRRFYGLRPTFPSHRLAARSPHGKSLVLLSEAGRRLLQRDATGKLRVVSTGVRLFEREVIKGVACPYRLAHGGLPHLLPHLGKQRVRCTVADAMDLMQRGELSADEVHARDGALAAALACCAAGSVVLAVFRSLGSGEQRDPSAHAGAADELAARQQPAVFIVAQLAPSGSLRPMVSKAAGQRCSLLHTLHQLSSTPL